MTPMTPPDAEANTPAPGKPRPGRRRGRGDLPAVVVALLVATALLAAFYTGILVRDAGTTDAPTDDSAAAGFARDMSVHHTQAVAMSELARRSDNPAVRTLAVDIGLTQQAQIGRLQGWLDQWGLPATGSEPAMAWMGEPAGTPMPGMATPAQMARLKHAEGNAANTLFLQMMIRHHRGALGMAQAALDLSDRPEVRSFAEKTIVAQTSEIAAMDSMLSDLGGRELSTSSLAEMTGHEPVGDGDVSEEGMRHGEDGGFTAGLSEFLGSVVLYLPVVLGAFAAAALMLDLARRQRWLPRGGRRLPLARYPVWVPLVLGSLMGSAAAHAALAPKHFEEASLYGWFFVASTAAAVVLAAALVVVRHPRVLMWSAGLLTGLLLLYLLFREIPPPLAHEPESFDAVGLLTQVIQVIGAAAALGLARLDRETPRTRHAD